MLILGMDNGTTYTSTWESIKKHQTPSWFKKAKFGKAQDKINSLKKAGVFIAESPSDMGLMISKAMGKE